MNMHFFTKSKKVVRYDTEGMTNDFNYVKHIVETTVNPAQFPALNNLINAFANKWKPIYPHRLLTYDYPVEEHNQEYEDAVNYLRLKMNYEYKVAV